MSAVKNTVEITDDNFNDLVLQSDVPMLIDFWAEWCGPCIAMEPTLEELAVEYEGKFKIGKLNVDQNSKTSMEYGIRSIPAMLFFKGGNVVDKQIGRVPKSVLKQKIEAQV